MLHPRAGGDRAQALSPCALHSGFLVPPLPSPLPLPSLTFCSLLLLACCSLPPPPSPPLSPCVLSCPHLSPQWFCLDHVFLPLLPSLPSLPGLPSHNLDFGFLLLFIFSPSFLPSFLPLPPCILLSFPSTSSPVSCKSLVGNYLHSYF